ncbi:hypothetical protein [Actinomadura rayongensis]|uniref:Uncharacterized protein n=1 Tax=Actinomadura rayongensis TaxID=1429076 RepID=A0A6I4W6N3_9ACTN|nr:hypothetical protein [Actinomadura rayongensis]MXQ65847.1 hypothetical protein [Actinomadura rayongensis]
MDRATWAIVLSTISVAISMVGIFWQLVSYRLSGSRIKVKMKPAMIDLNDHIVRGPERGWGDVDIPFSSPRWKVDVVELSIINSGRTAVSISEVSLDFGRPHGIKRGSHRISGTPVEMFGAIKDETFRLDAGESQKVIFDFWPMATAARNYRKGLGKSGSLTVRASVVMAGTRVRRSPWRKRWKIGSDQNTLRLSENFDAEAAAYSVLWGRFRISENFYFLSEVWYVFRSQVAEGKTPHEISDYLKEELNIVCGLAVLDAYKAYKQRDSGLEDGAAASRVGVDQQEGE